MCNKNLKSYDVRFLNYGVKLRDFFVILGLFLPFYPPNSPENQTFGKMKKASGDYFDVCTKNHGHDVCFLIYEVRQTQLFIILGQFLLFDPTNNMENQNLEKMEKAPGDIILLHM